MERSLQTPAGLMVVTRLANMVVGLLTIPVLIHFLGGEGFAAWAILLAISAAFSTLEMGMPPTFVRHVAGPIQREDWTQVNRVIGHVILLLALAFGACSPLVFRYAEPFARQIGLPVGDRLSAGRMIELVYAAVALRALLQTGVNALYAAMRFRAVAAVSFLQPFVSNGAACVAAIGTGSLELTLVCFWATQLVVLVAALAFAWGPHLRRIAPVAPSLSLLRELAAHGLKIQVYEWGQFVNFQFDKFLLALFAGLWAVAPYEVANRSVLALRSIPASGVETFLPTASISHEDGSRIRERYAQMTRLAALAVVVFMIAPVALAPIFLYAWTGEMGYVARWAFVALALGAACNVLAVPAAAIAQAVGRADLQARSATVSVLINIPLSFILVLQWQLLGAAVGTSFAMMISSALLVVEVHRARGWDVAGTIRMLASLWPLLAVCLVFGLLAYVPFGIWVSSLGEGVRYSRQTRLYPGAVAAVAYAACLTSMLVVQVLRGALTREQLERLPGFLRFKGFVA